MIAIRNLFTSELVPVLIRDQLSFLKMNGDFIMTNIKTIVIYSKKNISKYFLSPYVNFSFNNDGINFEQWLFKKNILVKCNVRKMSKFLEKLSKGLTKQKLTDYMQEIFGKDTNAVIINFMKNGIIE
jgi:hypothetical protein